VAAEEEWARADAADVVKVVVDAVDAVEDGVAAEPAARMTKTWI